MRLIDADKLKHIYPSDKEFHNVINHARTVKAIPISVIEDIKAEIEAQKKIDVEDDDVIFSIRCISCGLNIALDIIDKYKAESEGRTNEFLRKTECM